VPGRILLDTSPVGHFLVWPVPGCPRLQNNMYDKKTGRDHKTSSNTEAIHIL